MTCYRTQFTLKIIFCKLFLSTVDYFIMEEVMVKCNLSRIMGEKRLKIADVSKDTDINRGTITRMYNEEATRVDLEVVEKLCLYLDIEVGDLYEIVREEQ